MQDPSCGRNERVPERPTRPAPRTRLSAIRFASIERSRWRGRAEHRIAVFFSGGQHTGENLPDVLAQRAAELSAPIQMCDGLSRNVPAEYETILASCAAHARRKFVDVAANFPEPVRHVLEQLRDVYHNDAIAREREMSPAERLRFHQAESGPVMDDLECWLKEQIDEHEVEPNSGLGEAVGYMRKHWKELTLFLHEEGAPLDNSICERVLKKAILHRKNALFYKTENGARDDEPEVLDPEAVPEPEERRDQQHVAEGANRARVDHLLPADERLRPLHVLDRVAELIPRHLRPREELEAENDQQDPEEPLVALAELGPLFPFAHGDEGSARAPPNRRHSTPWRTPGAPPQHGRPASHRPLFTPFSPRPTIANALAIAIASPHRFDGIETVAADLLSLGSREIAREPSWSPEAEDQRLAAGGPMPAGAAGPIQPNPR